MRAGESVDKGRGAGDACSRLGERRGAVPGLDLGQGAGRLREARLTQPDRVHSSVQAPASTVPRRSFDRMPRSANVRSWWQDSVCGPSSQNPPHPIREQSAETKGYK